ncbi:MAG: leucyl aminopeptidase family protein [Saprospiraceae bacterium]|nr:leucyl aminopeptidase family protein [Saprospiraceae bacterium]
MQFSFTQDLNNLPGSIILPVSKNGSYEGGLSIASQLTGIEITWFKDHFSAEMKEMMVLPFQGKTLFLMGLGNEDRFTAANKTMRYLVHNHKSKLPKNFGLVLSHIPHEEDAKSVMEGCVLGLELGRYQIGIYKTEKTDLQVIDQKDVFITLQIQKDWTFWAQQLAPKTVSTARTQIRIMDLVNAPANKKRPEVLGQWAKDSGEQFGYSVKVLDKTDIEKEGLHGLLAVNRGSEDPPVFILMEYKPKKQTKEKLTTFGLIGKGVTFDTGGISLKPSSNMYLMKSDMGGAAAIMGTVELAARLQLQVHLVAAIPVTDNSIGSTAIKPSDVIQSYSGKTIEIIDTDAEGRLILADGLSYIAKNYRPDVMINAATLTGSAVRTFGNHAGALFSKNDNLADQLIAASNASQERLWRLPLWDSYADEIKSDVADVRNLSMKPTAGAISAAKFLEVFTDNHPAWAHMDIAGMCLQDSEFSGQRAATGFGPRLLTTFLENYKDKCKLVG